MAAFLSFNKIGKKVNNVNLLADFSFGAQKGELLFILGKSNSGKSTLFKILMGFIDKDKGQIFVDGMDYDIRKDEILSKIGYVPQNNIFDNDLNIYENLFLHAELCGLNNVKIKEKILYWANRLNFNQNLKDSIDSTSNSVLKKVAFAKALIQNPDILLIDDLTSSMDYYDRNIIFEIIQEIRASKSILFISQDFSIAELYSDRIIFISNGSVVFNGSTNSLEKEINDSYKYRFTFKRIAPVKFLKDLKQNKNIDKVVSKDNNIQITVKDKSIFFDVFKAAVDYELIDFNMSNSKITELFERIVES
tara:strand:- start:419 stop:1336 length:918 start_codon:yes stop_codon:yes gene_type:complete